MAARTDTPFGTGIGLGRVAGIPLRAHWSVLIIVVVLTALLATNELPALRSGEARVAYWLVAAGTALLFFLALCAHELAHAVVAQHYGLRVKRMTLWLLGGLTELDGEPGSARADGWIAAAGPLTTIVLGAGFAGAAFALGPHTLFGAAFVWLAVMSAVLAVFNLLPAAPLDGGRLLRAIIWRVTGDRRRAARVAAHGGRIVGSLLVVFGLLEALLGGLGGLWLALIGWFIVNGARSETYAAQAEQLSGVTAADVATPTPLTCPQWWTVAAVTERLDPAAAVQPALPVVDLDGRAIGAITLVDLQRVPADRAGTVRVDDLRARRAAVPIFPEHTPLTDVALAIHLGAHLAVVVDEAGRPRGVVDEAAVERAARMATLRR